MDNSVNDALNATAAGAGVSPEYWKAMASIESSLNASSNYNKPTQFKGLFQVGGPVWHDHGGGNIFNPMDNARAAAGYASTNAQIFRSAFGRDPSPIEVYMMHQQGPGFYTHGSMTNVAGNPYPGMSGPQTPQSFEAGWARELERRAKQFGGGGVDMPQSVAGSRSAPGGTADTSRWAATNAPLGSIPSNVVNAANTADAANAAPGAGGQTPDTSGPLAQLGQIRDRIAQEDQASQPQMAPMEPVQQAMTPGMMRARQMAAAMAMRPLGS